jgi:hypothetical protein
MDSIIAVTVSVKDVRFAISRVSGIITLLLLPLVLLIGFVKRNFVELLARERRCPFPATPGLFDDLTIDKEAVRRHLLRKRRRGLVVAAAGAELVEEELGSALDGAHALDVALAIDGGDGNGVARVGEEELAGGG